MTEKLQLISLSPIVTAAIAKRPTSSGLLGSYSQQCLEAHPDSAYLLTTTDLVSSTMSAILSDYSLTGGIHRKANAIMFRWLATSLEREQSLTTFFEVTDPIVDGEPTDNTFGIQVVYRYSQNHAAEPVRVIEFPSSSAVKHWLGSTLVMCYHLSCKCIAVSKSPLVPRGSGKWSTEEYTSALESIEALLFLVMDYTSYVVWCPRASELHAQLLREINSCE